MIWNIKVHHGKSIAYISSKMGYSREYLAKLKRVDLKEINDELNSEIIDVESLNWYANTLGITVEEMIFAEQMKDPNSEYWRIKTIRALEINNELLRILTLNGIKVDFNEHKL